MAGRKYPQNTDAPPVGLHHGGSGKVYMQHKISKLQTSSEFRKESTIFQGCFIFVNGYTDPPRNEIQRLVCINGGRFDSYQTSRTTHFICDIFPNAKLKELRKPKRVHIYYITVLWLVQSIKAGRRLPESDYLPQGLAKQHGVNMKSFLADVPVDSESVAAPPTEPEKRETLPNEPASSDPPPTCKNTLLGHYDEREPNSESSGQINTVATVERSGDTDSLDAQLSVRAPSDVSPVSAHPVRSRLTSATDPNFVQNYFESSRLHFIGSWKARLPALLASFGKEDPNVLPPQQTHKGGFLY